MRVSARSFWWSIAGAAFIGFGLVANPWLLSRRDMIEATLAAETVFAAVWLTAEVCRARRRCVPDTPGYLPTRRPPGGGALLPATFAAIVCMWALLYRDRWLSPSSPVGDDLDYLQVADNWRTTRDQLFVPYNEHIVLPTRILTFAIRWLARAGFGTLEQWMAAATFTLFLGCSALLFAFARQEYQSEAMGLLAVSFFAMTTTYREVIQWYSASQWLFSLSMVLLALWTAQGLVIRPTAGRLALLGLVCFAAPLTYSIGGLAGPMASFYLMSRGDALNRHRLATLVLPSLATLAGLTLVAALLAEKLASAEYREGFGRGPEEFAPIVALAYCARLVVDVLVLRNCGLDVMLGERLVIAVFPIIPVAVTLSLRNCPRTWSLWPYLALVAGSYAVTMPFRTWAGYLSAAQWSRYHLMAQAGAALFFAGVIDRCRCDGRESSRVRLTARQAIAVLVVAAVQFGLQFRMTR
jgi:hypothetical protein